MEHERQYENTAIERLKHYFEDTVRIREQITVAQTSLRAKLLKAGLETNEEMIRRTLRDYARAIERLHRCEDLD